MIARAMDKKARLFSVHPGILKALCTIVGKGKEVEKKFVSVAGIELEVNQEGNNAAIRQSFQLEKCWAGHPN